MSHESELIRLEGFVGKLLEKYQVLKEEYGQLQATLVEKEEIIEGLKNRLAANDLERNEISNRVSRIIEQIEGWEEAVGEGGVGTEVPLNDPSRQGNLFSMRADVGGEEE